MSAVPPTPFVPSRLAGAGEEDSLLLAQQPIFEDQSFDESSFWSTPKVGQSSRQHLDETRTVEQKGPVTIKDWDEETDDPTHQEDITLSGRGERPTWADEEGRSECSGSSKRVYGSPSSQQSTKRARSASTHVDDYYQRRLSRQSPRTSLASPSLSALDMSSTSVASFSSGERRQISELSIDSATATRRGGSEIDQIRPSLRRLSPSGEVPTTEPVPTQPTYRPTMLTKLLSRSSALQPSTQPFVAQRVPDPVELDLSHPQSEADRRRLSTSEDPPREPHCSPVSSDPAAHSSNLGTSTNSPSSRSSPSLRRSTSQRVLGFFSDLIRSTSSTSSHPSDPTGTDAPTVTDVEDPEDSVRPHDSFATQELGDNPEGEHQSGPSEGPADVQLYDVERPDSLQSIRQRPLREPAGFVPLTRPNKAFISKTASRIDNPVRRPRAEPSKPTRPTTSSSFASSALARLPPPGKGASSAGERVTIKPTERAANLQARRALFERPANGVMTKTIPLSGKTPGKASKARAEERHRFDKAVQNRIDDRKRERELEERQQREDEERQYAARRKETVIRANPVPDMYKRA